MGGKQSKRSVDISGEAGAAGGGGAAGEVAAAGAAGEGRVEPLADADALKPQLNGDAPHIQPPEEISEKEKQLENGTAENEKDATTEKETTTNGAAAEEQENGDAKPAADVDNNKKNKKEKVKKKWSLRSISFSRKDKPKQEKKQKDEEPKTNGETDKLPEEALDASAVAESKSSEDVKVVVTTEENKDEKTPETPVTEPITNGSSAPETPKEEEPAKEDSAVPSPTVEKTVEQVKGPEEPEKLPINGLSLEDVKEEVPEVKTIEAAESKVEQPAVPVLEEPASTPDIPVAVEVCVGQSPLSEPAPPPLPHNPPPSSVTAFAETTMALHTVDASLPPVSAASPALAATLEIVPSVEGSPLDSKLDSQLLLNDNVPPTITSTPLNDPSVDVNVNIKTDNSAEISAPITNFEPRSTAEEVNRSKTPEINGTPVPQILLEEKPLDTIEQPAVSIEHTIEVSDESKDHVIPLNHIQSLPLSEEPKSVVDHIVQVQDAVEVPEVAESVTENGHHKENGSNEDKETSCLNGNFIQASESVIETTKTIIDTVEINTKDSSLLENTPIIEPIAKAEHITNGSTLEAELAALQIAQKEQAVICNETIPLSAKPESLPIPEEVATVKSDETESPVSPLSEAPPPPAHDDANGSGEENRGSNEEVSGSFPLPPSELCPSESEASGPATPEPPQEEASAVIEKPVEVSITETLAEKTQLADIVEAKSFPAPEAAAAAVTTAGAGDGAPSD